MDYKTVWDSAYAEGTWERLTEVREVAHHATVAGYLSYFLRSPEPVLDLGCGEGLLVDYLAPYFYDCYTGVDISAVAIANARGRHVKRSSLQFVLAPIEDYAPPPSEAYGAIVLNEVLYYLENPIGTVTRLCAALRPGGVVIVSMWGGTTGKIHQLAVHLWAELAGTGWALLDETALTHTASSHNWRVAVFRP